MQKREAWGGPCDGKILKTNGLGAPWVVHVRLTPARIAVYRLQPDGWYRFVEERDVPLRQSG